MIEIILGIEIIVLAVILVVAVLFQSGKERGLSGSIVGGSESFGAKSKKAKKDAFLNAITTVIAITFAVVALALYIYITTSLK